MYRVQRSGQSVLSLTIDYISDGPSTQVLKAYEKEGFPMLLRAFNETGFLENLTGLDKLYNEGEAALESVDWEEDGEGEDF